MAALHRVIIQLFHTSLETFDTFLSHSVQCTFATGPVVQFTLIRFKVQFI